MKLFTLERVPPRRYLEGTSPDSFLLTKGARMARGFTTPTSLAANRQVAVSCIVLAAFALHGGCGDSSTAPPPPVPTSLTVAPEALSFDALGDTSQLTATVRDQGGQVIAGAVVTWASSDPAVASVSSSGVVTSVANGNATVTATAGVATGSAEVDVEQLPRSVLVTAPVDSLTVGDSIQMTAEALDDGGSAVAGATFAWASSDPAVAVVNQEGWVRARIPGSVEITASLGDLSASAPLVALPLPEPEVLAAIYQATNGALWKDNTNWLTSAPLEEWFGVHLDDDGRIVHILLTDNGLIGSIPPEIASLTTLESLHIGLNDLTGPFPPEIATLRRLKSLELTYNGLSGPIPPEIGGLDSLQWLGLFGNELTGSIPPEIGGLTSLVSLDLCYNQLTGPIPPEIGRLRNLVWLKMCGIDSNPEAGNRLTGSIPPEIGNLTNLRVLNLGANRLSGPIPPEIGKLANLDSLSLYSNELTGIPPEIGMLESLESMLIYGNRLTGPIPPQIGNLSELGSLIAGLGLTSGANLLTGSIPPEIGGLAHLTRLDLGGNQLTGSIPPEIGALSALEHLELGSNALSGPLPPEIGNLGRLGRLSLCNNSLEGSIPPRIGLLSELRQMYLCRNRFTGPVPPEIGDMAEMRHLNFAVNRLTGELPASMVALRRLQSFNWAINDGLCAPATEVFLDWLAGITTAKGERCARPAAGTRTVAGATVRSGASAWSGDATGARALPDVVQCTVSVAGGRPGWPAWRRGNLLAANGVAGRGVTCDPVTIQVRPNHPN